MGRQRWRDHVRLNQQSQGSTNNSTPPRNIPPGPRLNWRLALPALLALGVAVPLTLWVLHKGEPRLAVQAFARVGWGLVGVVLVRAATILLCAAAWSCLLRRLALPIYAFQAVRFIREGINGLLPLAAVGGDILGMRLITFWGVTGGLAIASVTVDVTLQAATQGVFTLLGLALMVKSYGAGPLGMLIFGGVAALLTALLVFQLVQRRGANRLERLLERMLSRDPRLAGAAPLGLHAAFMEIWRDRAGIAGAAALHFAAWLVGVFEIWIALLCMGYSREWQVAAMLESLSQGLRSLAFPVPAGIGVQEGGLIAVGQMLGLEPGAALAVSMVKRVPDIVLGAPALLAWVGLEARHTVRKFSQRHRARWP
jgi:putative membrane protein